MAGGDRTQAIATIAESGLLDASPALRFSLGTLQFEEGDLEDAVANLESAVEQFPNFRDAHRNLAVIMVQQGDFESAQEHLVRAIELGSREGLTLGMLGYCHAIAGHPRAALDAYRLAMVTQPDERQWKIGQAQALGALKRAGDAIEIYDHLLDDQPADLDIWLVQADGFVLEDRPEDAVTNLELVYRTGDLTADATVSLGHLYLRSGLPQFAHDRYRAAIAHETPVSFAKAVEAVEILTNARQWSHARDLGETIAAAPTYDKDLGGDDTANLSKLVRSRAFVELMDGDATAGEKLVEDWLADEPLDGLALILLARFREDKGAREEAEMLLERAAATPDHAAEALRAHGRLLVTFAEYSEALALLEKAQNLEPTNSLADYIAAVRELAP
ncbi:MAG: tetratricopeptide repeat protein [Planctomycetota bacterium]